MGVLMLAGSSVYSGVEEADPRFAAKRPRSCSGNMAVNGGPSFYTEINGFMLETRDTEFGRIVEPISLREYKPAAQQYLSVPQPGLYRNAHPPLENGFSAAQSSVQAKEVRQDSIKTRPPPKKKWIKEYFEEEVDLPVSVSVVSSLPLPRSNGVVVPRASTPVPVPAHPLAAIATATAATAPQHQHLPADYNIFEHSRPRSNSHGFRPSIPSPSSTCSGTSTRESGAAGSAGTGIRAAGTREVHNKLEKNRRAHLKECFELLKRQLPANADDKKASNLSILGSANRYIQVLRRRERECEHEMERLAREKIAAQQRLAALKREVAAKHTHQIGRTQPSPTPDECVNGQLLGIPISITSSLVSSPSVLGSSVSVAGAAIRNPSPPHTLNMNTKLRTLPIQISSSNAQMVRAAYGGRHNTLTLTALAPADHPPSTQNGHPKENGLSPQLGTALVHPAHLHLPLSQVVTSNGVVVGQLLSGPGALRVLQQPTHMHNNNGATGRDNGLVPTTSTESIIVSPSHHMLQQSYSQKMMETQVMKTVSAQYLTAGTLVKPMVVVSGAPAPSAPSSGT